MNDTTNRSEIRDSVVRELIEKVRKQNYGNYLLMLRLERIRFFRGAEIVFDFPVTALIGPNGGGKSTILGACGCVYKAVSPGDIFKKSRIGDEAMADWILKYRLIEKIQNPRGVVEAEVRFENDEWLRNSGFSRPVAVFGIGRTLSAAESPYFQLRRKLSGRARNRERVTVTATAVGNISDVKREAERILGRSLASMNLLEMTVTTQRQFKQGQTVVRKEVLPDGTEVTYRQKREPILVTRAAEQKQQVFVGSNQGVPYSEFNFGSGEASVIRLVAAIERLPDNALILIEEIENGLHPLAVRRMVEYLIDVAKRKSAQVVFTTHSDYALAPLPPEATWAAMDGRLQQGKLSVEVLRAVTGRVDRRLAIFVEDEFAKAWIEAIGREELGEHLDEIGVYPVHGDGNAVNIHLGHTANPSVSFRSLCFIDGDSPQREDNGKGIFRLPGRAPETTVFNSVLTHLDTDIAVLTAALQRQLNKQDTIVAAVRNVSLTNRDPHLLFSQIGVQLGLLPEATVRGAFIALWMQENPDGVARIVEPIKQALELPPK